jgi:hypothetical protein
MRVLSIIEKFNQAVRKPRIEELHASIGVNVSMQHLEYLVATLVDMGYIDKIRDSELHPIFAYSITAQGSNHLREYDRQASEFAHTAKTLSRSKKMEDLYKHLSQHRRMLWYAYFNGLLRKKDLDNFTKVVGKDMKHFFFDKREEFYRDMLWDGYGVF